MKNVVCFFVNTFSKKQNNLDVINQEEKASPLLEYDYISETFMKHKQYEHIMWCKLFYSFSKVMCRENIKKVFS